jgi:hypothetical protein
MYEALGSIPSTIKKGGREGGKNGRKEEKEGGGERDMEDEPRLSGG